MTVTGGTQAIGIVLSIIRMKVLALLLGPPGVGVLSIYTNLQTTGVTLAGLGLSSSGVRQIAKSKGTAEEVDLVRRVILWANALQGVLAMALVWIFRDAISNFLFDGPGYGTEVGLVGIAIFLSLLSASQTALLRGLRRIGDLGRVTVLGALAGTLVGICAIWMFGMDGLVALVIAQPLTAVLVASYFTRRLPPPTTRVARRPADILTVWKPMVQLGAGFMIGGLASSGTLLLVRGKIASDLGLDAAGQFAAAWGITVTYVGFMLNAMSMDYYPRLAEIIEDRDQARSLMNEQLQIGLLIGTPILVALIGLAPLAIRILYSDQFDDAVTLLQWQTLGNILKLSSWSLSISVVAAARSRMYLLMEASFLIPFVFLCYVFLPRYGVDVAGIAFLICYAIYFLTALSMARRIADFHFESRSMKLLAISIVIGGGVLALSLTFPLAGGIAAIVSSLGTGFVGGHILLEKVGLSRYTAPMFRFYSFVRWPVSD
ncbi:oligosaccharide flippase family protein [Erythrobacter sp. 3-20A1M]|uniref:O-antigen translocase n=1 Tax=Erythrobacter sp. 3-20A1M TaxID=2653850 RepID=UPI001BFC35CB|nr:O-antigen translocase [Erythrobacter sp. 3-20A1M]QWC57953.1 oligosaccharide flippase family protein [Erythrobacter sp. 3-20A1M]